MSVFYAGPVVRVNYDTELGGKLGAHFGGSLQALYGRSGLKATQAFTTETNTFEASDNGFMLGVEAEAGLSYQITPSIALGVGVYGSLTQGAPEVAAATDPAATEEATRHQRRVVERDGPEGLDFDHVLTEERGRNRGRWRRLPSPPSFFVATHAPRRETQAASRMTRAVWKPTSPFSRLKVVRDLA